MLNGFNLYKKLLITSSVMALSLLSCNLDGFNNSKNALKSTNSTSKLKLSKSKENLTNFINEVKNSKIITKDTSNNKIKEISLHDLLKKDSKTFNTKAAYPLIDINYELSNPSTGTFNCRTIPGLPPNPPTTVCDNFSFSYTRHSFFSVNENTNFSFIVNSSRTFDAVGTCSNIVLSDSVEYSSGINITPDNFPYNLENGKNIHDVTVSEQMILPLFLLQNGSNHFAINNSTLNFDVPLTGKQKIVLDVNLDQINLSPSQSQDIIIKSSPNTMDPFNISLISPDGSEIPIAQCKRFTDSFNTFNNDFIPINYKIPQSLPEGEYKIKSYLVANHSVFTEFPITLIKDIQATPTPQPSSDPCNTSSTAFSVKALSTEDRNNLIFLKQMLSKVEEIISVENIEKEINIILAALPGSPGNIVMNNAYLDKVKPDNYRKLITILKSLDTIISNSTGKTNQYALELKSNTNFLLSQIGLFPYDLSTVLTMYDVRINDLKDFKNRLIAEAQLISRKFDKIERLSALSGLTQNLIEANNILLSKNYSSENRTMIEELVVVNDAVKLMLRACSSTCSSSLVDAGNAQMNLILVAEKAKNMVQDIRNSLALHQILPSDPDSDIRNMLAKLEGNMATLEANVKNASSNGASMTLALQNTEQLKLQVTELYLEIQQEIVQAQQEKEECKKINAALSLKADKKSFSPNNDNIDDIVSFNIIAGKDKPWTLEITSPDLTNPKTFVITGIGTGETQNITWDGKDSSGNVFDDASYDPLLTTSSESKSIRISIHNYNDLIIMTYPEKTLEDEVIVEEPPVDNTENTFSVQADVTPPTSAYIEFVKKTVTDSGNPKAKLINDAIDQAMLLAKDRTAQIKLEKTLQQTVAKAITSYNPKQTFNINLQSLNTVLQTAVIYSAVKDLAVSHQDLDAVTVDTNYVDTYQRECKVIKFKSTIQSSGFAPNEVLKGKWQIFYLNKESATNLELIEVKAIDDQAVFNLDKAELNFEWDGTTKASQRTREGKYMAVFVPNADNDNLVLPNTGVRFRFKKAVSFLFNIVDGDKIADDVKKSLVSNSSFSTQSVAGMMGNFTGAKIPLLSAGTTEINNSTRKLDIAGKKLNGAFTNPDIIYNGNLKNYNWVSPLVAGLEDVIDPYNMAGVMCVVDNGKAILDEAIKNEGCSRYSPRSMFLKTVRALMPVAKADLEINLKPVTNHNKKDVLMQIGDSNHQFRLLYINALRGLNNPNASGRTVAGSGSGRSGADVTFEGVSSNDIKYVEFKCPDTPDINQSITKNGYKATSQQISDSRNTYGYGLGLAFVQIKGYPINLNSNINYIKNNYVNQSGFQKDILYTLTNKSGNIILDTYDFRN